ncbi:NAD(P)H-dependent oxidoreductase [Nocardia caishijiensis]|uniref:NAD(P)H-dependent FMN reductase n=1 Tax=Nocardia caishijiensis TaxID=184756 RepID=A0ABQ6YEK8_9NOCA|nr:NAD(P)H-dependent oxidoreductase [Nocardia caishijiensis]KAF0835753.1 NAD(P)H-dependent FMN reductase [Nocardia caishijiensis]
MIRIGIILGSTRHNRHGDQVAWWVLDSASRRGDAEFELIDLRDHPLPHFDEAAPPMFGPSANEHTRAWTARIAPFDGFIVVTPEYNGGVPGVLKNAFDHAFAEWTDKAVAFVGYGVNGGARAVVQLRTVCGTLGMADVAHSVSVGVLTDFEDNTSFVAREHHDATLGKTLDQLVAWTTALTALRRPADDTAAISDRIDRLVECLRTKDLDGIGALYTDDAVSFDIEPPLRHRGRAAKLANWARVFQVFDTMSYEFRDLTFTVGADVAYGYGFGRLRGTLRTGEVTDGMWVRATLCLRKVGGAWLIAHDQVSVPLDIPSGKALVDLEP